MKSASSIFRYYLERLGLKFRLRSLIFFYLALPTAIKHTEDDRVMIMPVSLNDLLTEHVIGWLTFDQARQYLANPFFKLFVALQDGVVVGSYWLETHFAELDFLDLNEPLPENTAYLTHLFVKPEKRGLRIAEALLNNACTQAYKMGKNRLTVCCVPENLAVRKTNFRMGFNEYLVVHYFRLIFFRTYLCISTNKRNKNRSLTFGGETISLFKPQKG